MAEQQQHRIEEAARQFSDALVESYRAVSERTVSAEQLSAELTQDFFNGVINNLRAQGGTPASWVSSWPTSSSGLLRLAGR
jgi:hypothetical protein